MTHTVELDVSELLPEFPSVRIALIAAVNMSIPVEYSTTLREFLSETERDLAARLAHVELATIPDIRVWRDAYRAFGVKKTSYRSSIERLLKSLQRGGGLPRVHALVDLYNAVSALHLMPIGADDLCRVMSPLTFRYARAGDTFIALGDASMAVDPPKQGEVVYADSEKCLCRRWNWYQDARSAVTAVTTDAVLTVQALAPVSAERLESVTMQLTDLIAEHCGGSSAFAVADKRAPRIAVATSQANRSAVR